VPETREFLSVDDFDDGSFAWGKFGRQWVAGGVEIEQRFLRSDNSINHLPGGP
jgi:hypothetical protein